MYRDNQCTLAIGRRGSGKSTLLLKIVQAYADRTNKPVVIYDVENNKVYRDIPIIRKEYIPALVRGVYRCIDRDTKGFIDIARWQCRNMMIVCEDAMKYFYDDYKIAIDMIIASKQRNIDLFFTFHAFADVKPKFLRHSNIFMIFKTGEDWKGIKGRIPCAHLVEPVFKEVQQHPNRYFHKAIKVN